MQVREAIGRQSEEEAVGIVVMPKDLLKAHVAKLGSAKGGSDALSWPYQTCTEWGFYQVDGGV